MSNMPITVSCITNSTSLVRNIEKELGQLTEICAELEVRHVRTWAEPLFEELGFSMPSNVKVTDVQSVLLIILRNLHTIELRSVDSATNFAIVSRHALRAADMARVQTLERVNAVIDAHLINPDSVFHEEVVKQVTKALRVTDLATTKAELRRLLIEPLNPVSIPLVSASILRLRCVLCKDTIR
jgi:hypothetical protein